MSHDTKAAIKSVFIIALGAASVHIYAGMVNDYVIDKIISYYEE